MTTREQEAQELIDAHGSDAVKDALVQVLFESEIITVMSQEFSSHDEDGDESRYDRILLDVGTSTDDDVQKYVDEHYPREHCMHEYDCCGHWYMQYVSYDRSGKFAVVTCSYIQNI